MGDYINSLLALGGIMLPSVLTAMASGIALSNLGRMRGWNVHAPSIDLAGDVSLKLFLAMSLRSLSLMGLSTMLGPIAAIMLAQAALVLVVPHGWPSASRDKTTTRP